VSHDKQSNGAGQTRNHTTKTPWKMIVRSGAAFSPYKPRHFFDELQKVQCRVREAFERQEEGKFFLVGQSHDRQPIGVLMGRPVKSEQLSVPDLPSVGFHVRRQEQPRQITSYLAIVAMLAWSSSEQF
jgi:hypothetical protein